MKMFKGKWKGILVTRNIGGGGGSPRGFVFIHRNGIDPLRYLQGGKSSAELAKIIRGGGGYSGS